MILRKRIIDASADEVQIALSYTVADIRNWCRTLYAQLRSTPVALKYPWSQQEIVDFFRQSRYMDFQEKYSYQLARWAAATAIRKKYFIEDLNKKGCYFLSDKLSARPGRKSEDEQNNA